MNKHELLKTVDGATKKILDKISLNSGDVFKNTLSASILFGGAVFSASSFFCETSFIDAISNSMIAISGKNETSIHDFVTSLINPVTTPEKIRLIGSIIILSSPIPAMTAKIIDTIIDIKKLQEQFMEAGIKEKTTNIDISKYTRKDPVLSDFMNLWIKGYNAENNSGLFSLIDGSRKSINLASILLLKNSAPVEKDFFNQTIDEIRKLKNNGKKLTEIITIGDGKTRLKRIKELKVMYSISSSKETKKAIVSSLSSILSREKPDIDIAKLMGFSCQKQDQKNKENTNSIL